MSALATISEAIQMGEISTYLSGNDNAAGVLWGKRLNAPASPVQIATCTDALKWQYEDLLAIGAVDQDPTLRGTANYLVWMCGKYGLQALNIISGGGGGSVIPTPSPANRPLPLDFVVSATSIIPTGATGFTIAAFIGWNLQFDRGGITQNTTDVGDGSSYYGWVRANGTFSVSPSLQEGELVRLTPV